MDFYIIFTFIAISLMVLITPGVTVAFVVSQSLVHGKSSAIPLALGVAAGDFICLLASLAGLKAIIWAYPGFEVGIQVLGAMYIIYIGLVNLNINSKKASEPSGNNSGSTLFTGALWVTLLNPKSILFFGAFLPQFIGKEHSIIFSFLLLGLIFMVIAFLISFVYAYVCASIKDNNKNLLYTDNLQWVSSIILILLGSATLLSTYSNLGLN